MKINYDLWIVFLLLHIVLYPLIDELIANWSLTVSNDFFPFLVIVYVLAWIATINNGFQYDKKNCKVNKE